eukprot:5754709-Amphidinium_carterae.1
MDVLSGTITLAHARHEAQSKTAFCVDTQFRRSKAAQSALMTAGHFSECVACASALPSMCCIFWAFVSNRVPGPSGCFRMPRSLGRLAQRYTYHVLRSTQTKRLLQADDLHAPQLEGKLGFLPYLSHSWE